MKDPYEVLGIPRTASKTEVTETYRKLAKKFHPDLNPNDKNAQSKMAEINVAYEEIKSGRAEYTDYSRPNSASSQRGSPYQGYGQYGGGYNPFEEFFRGAYSGGSTQQQRYAQPQKNDQFDPVRQYINALRYSEALYALSQIQGRSGQWYYLSAIANYGSGNTVTAMQHIDQALQLEPSNSEYMSIKQQMMSGSQAYTTKQRGFGIPNLGINPLCLGLCLARLCCRC